MVYTKQKYKSGDKNLKHMVVLSPKSKKQLVQQASAINAKYYVTNMKVLMKNIPEMLRKSQTLENPKETRIHIYNS